MSSAAAGPLYKSRMSKKRVPQHRLKLHHKPSLYRQYLTKQGGKVAMIGTSKGLRVAPMEGLIEYDELNAYIINEGDIVAECPVSDVITSLLRCDKYASVPTRHYKALKPIIEAVVKHLAPELSKRGHRYMLTNIPRKSIGQDLKDHTVVALLDESDENKKSATRGYAKKKVGQGYGNCPFCGCQLNAGNATADHIIPFSECKNNSPANLVPSCRDCNSERGTRDFYEFLAFKRSDDMRRMFPGVKVKRLKVPV